MRSCPQRPSLFSSRRDLILCRRPLHGQQLPVLGDQRQAPCRQPSRGATARAVTTSKSPVRGHPRPGRPPDVRQPELGDHLVEEAVRRSSGSSRVTGGPAGDREHDARQAGPGADVDDRAPSGTSVGEHRAVQQVPIPEPGTSRGPIRPRGSPRSPAGRRTARASVSRRMRTPAAPPPGAGLFHVKHRSSGIRRQDHHVAPRLHALGLRRQAGGGHGVVHDLALERRHRRRAPPARRSP